MNIVIFYKDYTHIYIVLIIIAKCQNRSLNYTF